MKTLSKILIALCMLANAQVLIAQEANTRCLSEDGQVLTAQEQKTKGDPMCRFQWHLSGEAFARQSRFSNKLNTNSSTRTVHLNVAEVWDKYKGDGTYIAIVEKSPMDINHPDLKENIAIEYNHIYRNSSVSSHATIVAGVAAARGYNGKGVRGVAPRAYMFELSSTRSSDDILNTFIRHRTITAVSNHSYGHYLPFGHIFEIEMRYLAMETGINEGFHGKGTVYVFSAGNRRNFRDNSNYDPYTNYHAVIAVCGVDYQGKHDGYSEPGANLWVCALLKDGGFKYGIVTTDRVSTREYTVNAGGTSSSAPMVSGIVALMRQANRNLSWRDVKVILADSAVKTDPDYKGWGQSGMKYGSFDKYYHFNHQYGFGLVDAKAAVDLAEEWVNLPPREEDTVVKEEVNSTARTISKSLSVESDIDFIEHVDATIGFSINKIRDLSIELISPSGTTSILATPGLTGGSNNPRTWRFGSSRHLGEQASGEWRLIARNARAGNTITLRSWELRIRGYQVKLEAVAAEDLSDLNVATDDSSDSPPLTLSLHGALWKDTLEPSDFRLQNAPKNLSIASVDRTSSTQVQLKLKLTNGELDKAYDFQVVATTGTVSNRTTPLISNAIEIARIAHNKEAVISQVTKGFYYSFTAKNILSSPTTLSYTIELVDEDGNEVGLEGTGFMLNAPTISGTPQVLGTHRFKITATRQSDPPISRTEYITLNVQPPHTVRTQIKVYPEGLLSE